MKSVRAQEQSEPRNTSKQHSHDVPARRLAHDLVLPREGKLPPAAVHGAGVRPGAAVLVGLQAPGVEPLPEVLAVRRRRDIVLLGEVSLEGLPGRDEVRHGGPRRPERRALQEAGPRLRGREVVGVGREVVLVAGVVREDGGAGRPGRGGEGRDLGVPARGDLPRTAVVAPAHGGVVRLPGLARDVLGVRLEEQGAQLPGDRGVVERRRHGASGIGRVDRESEDGADGAVAGGPAPAIPGEGVGAVERVRGGRARGEEQEEGGEGGEGRTGRGRGHGSATK